MSDLMEGRLERELAQRADQVAGWALSGPALRGRAQARASQRRMRATVLGCVLAVVVALAATTWAAGGTGTVAPPADPVPTDTAQDTPSMRVDVPTRVVDAVRNQLGAGDATLVATAKLRSTGRTALVFVETNPGPRMTAFTVTLDGTEPVLGTLAQYAHVDDVIAQPVRDGDRAVLAVVVPESLGGEVVEVTVGRPGRAPVVESGPVIGRVALVPVPHPDRVTELRVLRNGLDVHVGIPGGGLLGSDAPPRLDRVAASLPTGQLGSSMQLRTDGRTACWLTASGFEAGEQFVTGWNLADHGCAPTGTGLHLLLPGDLGSGPVLGLAPHGAEQIRLIWRDGTTTTVPVVGDRTAAGFVATDERPADQLTRVDALAPDGAVIASERLSP